MAIESMAVLAVDAAWHVIASGLRSPPYTSRLEALEMALRTARPLVTAGRTVEIRHTALDGAKCTWSLKPSSGEFSDSSRSASRPASRKNAAEGQNPNAANRHENSALYGSDLVEANIKA